jgi:hypothetical protein
MENNNLLPAPKRNCVECLKQLVRKHWQPTPIDPPKPDTDLENLSGPQRSAEVIRYSILSLEFWLSPLGRIREWVRLNGKLCALLLIPALLILPLITFIISQIANWLIMLVDMMGNLIVFPVLLIIAVGAISGTILLLRAIFGR